MIQDLNQLSLEELRSIRDGKRGELDLVQDEIGRRVNEKLVFKQAWYMENIDLLLQLVPSHQRRGCTDESRWAVSADCSRCYLLECKRCHCWLDREYDLEIDISVFNTNYRQGYHD